MKDNHITNSLQSRASLMLAPCTRGYHLPLLPTRPLVLDELVHPAKIWGILGIHPVLLTKSPINFSSQGKTRLHPLSWRLGLFVFINLPSRNSVLPSQLRGRAWYALRASSQRRGPTGILVRRLGTSLALLCLNPERYGTTSQVEMLNGRQQLVQRTGVRLHTWRRGRTARRRR
ncbi:hypothetical protein Mapa_003503 [Marchantia paleacea]|nr:hypothetical protein Mapa_003503 [Marchantia paleacea]